MVNCSPSTLRRKLNENGVKLGATKLKRGWIIPHTTLEALGVVTMVGSVNSSHDQSRTVQNDPVDTSLEELRTENTRLRVENATLRAENDGLKQLLAEREKVVALLEARPSIRESWWSRFVKRDREAD